MDGIEFILTAIVVSLYVLLGSFWAWLLGVVPITLPWFAVVVLWPVIGFFLFIACIMALVLVKALVETVRA